MIFAKQYKAASPTETVQRIKRLLADVGIKVKEETRSLKDLVYSARITITNGLIEELDLGSNGKGVSPEYALASGYAELMERLQTRLLYDDMLMLPPAATKKFLGRTFFRCAPEEVLRKADWSFFPKQGKGVDNLHVGRTAYATMLAVRTGRKETVPLELMRYMTGSTGACAGNTREEALVQGMCEILERHALQKVFTTKGKGIPTIPLKAFGKSPALDRLVDLGREQGLKFAVKDCSFGTGMPILGLLVWNDASYQFRIGVASSPDVALSRCFTEIFQGYTGNECLLPKDPKQMIASLDNYQRAKVNGTGHLPIGIFAEVEGGTLDNFRQFEGKDIAGDYEVLTNALLSAGYDIYVRDCSFLGFPAYYIYIPGLSDIYPQLLDFQKRIDRCMRVIHRASTRFLPSYNSAYLPWKYPLALFAFAQSVRKRDYNSAQRHFRTLLGHQLPKTAYNEAVMEFIRLRADSRHLGFIKEEIGKHWGEQIAELVLSEFGPNAEISAIFRLPTCFNCDICPTRSRCALGDLSKLDAVIRRKNCEFSRLMTGRPTAKLRKKKGKQ